MKLAAVFMKPTSKHPVAVLVTERDEAGITASFREGYGDVHVKFFDSIKDWKASGFTLPPYVGLSLDDMEES